MVHAVGSGLTLANAAYFAATALDPKVPKFIILVWPTRALAVYTRILTGPTISLYIASLVPRPFPVEKKRSGNHC